MDYAMLNKLIEGTTANFDRLSGNVVMAAGRVTDAATRIDDAVKTLNITVKTASDSSDRQSRAMWRLTVALIVVGLLQIFVPLIYSRIFPETYVVCTQSSQNTIVCTK
jgi:hypothetical protein